MTISVHTEMTDDSKAPSRGWVFYDGDCQFCLAWVRRTEPILGPRGFAFVPLQTPGVPGLLQLREDPVLSEMRVLLRTGESFGGADAIIELAKLVCWAWPLLALARIPGMRQALRAAYRQIAARRYCRGGAGSVRAKLSSSNSPAVGRGVST
jgi:predicted DCC family thiol-disulfide oxidoreductase YuxK